MDEIKEYILEKINKLHFEPTAPRVHGMSREDTIRFATLMNIYGKIEEIEQNNSQ